MKYPRVFLSKSGNRLLESQLEFMNKNCISLGLHDSRILNLESEMTQLKSDLKIAVDLANKLDLYTIHSRAHDGCPSPRNCNCGLWDLRKQLKEI